MNFNYSYNDEKDSVIELICDLEINSIINAINKDFGCSMFSDLIKDMATNTKTYIGKEKLKATKELNETFRNMINGFPPDILEKHHLRLNAKYLIRVEEDSRECDPNHIRKKILNLPSNDEIEDLWKTKRQVRKALQEQVVAGGMSLK